MGVDIEYLKQQSILIRDEYRRGANTANRVGSLFLALCERLAEAFDIKDLDKRYLRKDQPDSTKFLIQFFAGLEAGLYAEGGIDGSKLHSDGLAELGRLQVNGHSEFRGNLSSKDFVSGFMTGKGWAMQLKKFINSAGVEETKAVGELDDLIVRGTLRVFEFVVSQMLGENDNRVFTAMLEVDHYDPATGRVWLDTQNGKLYNPFRVDDCIVVQQYNGMPSNDNGYYITKQYELVVTGVGVGDMSLGEDRLDWVTFKNFTTTMEGGDVSLITKGDTFVRWDNFSDPNRKGIIQLMTVGESTPYMDIAYGLKTDPDNAHKGRVGNLEGIYHHLFGWLESFGAYLINLYAVGDFRLRRTGESLDSRIEMLAGLFATNYSKLTYEITEEDNYLTNASFTENLNYWLTDASDARFVSSNDAPFLMNGSLMTVSSKIAAIEECEGRNRLRLKSASIRQLNSDIRKPGTHKVYVTSGTDTTDDYTEEPDKLYLSVKFLPVSSGTLTLGFVGASSDIGALPFISQSIDRSNDWQTIQASGSWDGVGDFVLSYTGDMYVSLLSLTADPLSDFKSEVSTSIEQTATNIRLLGTNINNIKGTVTQLGIDLDAANERISVYATKVDNNTSSISLLQVKTDSISSAVTSVSGDLTVAKIRLEEVAAVAESAGDAEVYDQGTNPWSSWAAGSEYKHVGATWHCTSTFDNFVSGHTYRYIGYDNSNSWEDVTDQQESASYILQNKDKISTVVASFDSEGNLTNTSGLVTTSYATSVYATKTTVDTLSGRVSTAEARIDVHSTQISMRVEKDGIISAINQSAESITIDASKINLDGDVIVSGIFKGDFQCLYPSKMYHLNYDGYWYVCSNLGGTIKSNNIYFATGDNPDFEPYLDETTMKLVSPLPAYCHLPSTAYGAEFYVYNANKGTSVYLFGVTSLAGNNFVNPGKAVRCKCVGWSGKTIGYIFEDVITE